MLWSTWELETAGGIAAQEKLSSKLWEGSTAIRMGSKFSIYKVVNT